MSWDDIKERAEIARHQQAIGERNAAREWGITIRRVLVPKGSACNPSTDRWCEHLHCDWCDRYKTLLWTRGGIGGGFHEQRKSKRCLKAHPNGESGQLTLFDEVAG